jgi:hypothetical protein
MAMSYTRNYGTNNVIRSLYAKKRELDARMIAVAKQGAEEIMELSKSLAPVDEGHLEEAHQVIDRNTRSGNFAFDVFVDPTVADLGEYLDFIHNSQYNLGPKSEAKAASTGMAVGPKFLERAFDRSKPELLLKYRAIVKNFTRP